VATQDVGNLGTGTGESVLFRWRWYYSVPGLLSWIILLLLLLVPRHNRNFQAWLILILPLLVNAFFLLIQTMIPGLSSELDGLGQFCMALSIAWSSVWLLGPWLHGRNRARNALRTLAAMFLIGAAGYVGFFGFWISSDVTWPIFGFWTACAVSLVVATALSGYFCGGSCSPLRLLLWPALWIPIISGTCCAILYTALVIFSVGFEALAIEFLLMIAIQVIMVSAVAGVILYLLNLPVVLLCIFSPCYRERFCSGFGRPSKEFERDRYRKAATSDDPIDPAEALRKTK
jgi:hypothetical protein